MTTIIKARDVNGTKRELEAVFPADLDPRFDFARTKDRLIEVTQKRVAYARQLLGGGNYWAVTVVAVDTDTPIDPTLVDQTKVAAADWS